MSENSNNRNFPPQNRPPLEPDELDDATLDEVVGGLANHSQMSFNLQYLQLQSSMQNENRSYTAVGNIMNSKKKVASNTPGNIR